MFAWGASLILQFCTLLCSPIVSPPYTPPLCTLKYRSFHATTTVVPYRNWIVKMREAGTYFNSRVHLAADGKVTCIVSKQIP